MLCSGPSSFCFAAASVATRAKISSWYSLLVAPQDYGISDKDLVQAFQVWFCLRVDGRLCQAHVGAKPFDLQGDMLFWLHVVERVSPVSRFAMELAEVSRRIANVRRQLRRSQPYGRPCCGLSSETMVAGLLVFEYSGSSFECVRHFFQRHAWPERSLEEAEDAFAFMYRTTRSEDIVKISVFPPRQALVRAILFILCFRLWRFVKEQNEQRGVAPHRQQLIQFALAHMPKFLDAQTYVVVSRPLLGTQRTQQKFLRKFRLQWSAKIGKLRPSPPVGRGILQEKAGTGNETRATHPEYICARRLLPPVFGGPILGMVWDLLLQIFNPSNWGAVLGFILGFMVARSLLFFGGATKQFRTTALW